MTLEQTIDAINDAASARYNDYGIMVDSYRRRGTGYYIGIRCGNKYDNAFHNTYKSGETLLEAATKLLEYVLSLPVLP